MVHQLLDVARKEVAVGQLPVLVVEFSQLQVGFQVLKVFLKELCLTDFSWRVIVSGWSESWVVLLKILPLFEKSSYLTTPESIVNFVVELLLL